MASELVTMGGPQNAVAVYERETSVAAVAAQAKASVEARYVMAMQNPRDIDEFREKLLKECKRPFFAEVARYRKPIGGGSVEGPSIRFVETALRCFRNVLRETPTIYEDDEKRIVRASVTDLEANVTHWTDVTVAKTVERRSVKEGTEVVGQRVNTEGKTVYIVRATDDELLTKTNALISKAVRNMGLNILPGDIVEEAQHFCVKTRQTQDAQDPDAARLKIVDAFATVGVKVVDLTGYVGHSLDTLSPAELDGLRKDFAALKDGEISWTDLTRARSEQSADKNAADRSSDVLDDRDIAKVKAAAANVGKKHDAPAEIVLADVLALDDPKDAEMALSGIPKADLPKILAAIVKWAPA
jgi:hypothetical protein